MPGIIAFEYTLTMTRFMSRLRRRPTGPPSGLRPNPNGGTSSVGYASSVGWIEAHGRPVASAATTAPYEFMSVSSTSGCERRDVRDGTGPSRSGPRFMRSSSPRVRRSFGLETS